MNRIDTWIYINPIKHFLNKPVIIYYYEDFSYGGAPFNVTDNKTGTYLGIKDYSSQIKRLINSLNDFAQKKATFSEPDKYLEFILSSVANEINTIIAEKKEKENNNDTKH